MTKSPLLDQVREVLRLRHYSIRAEEAYSCAWRMNRREPDFGGVDFWLNKLNQFDGNFLQTCCLFASPG